MRTSVITCLILLLVVSACSPTPPAVELVSPNIFIRGLQLNQGVRYAATFIKPTDETQLNDVLVEITLSTRERLTEISVPGQARAAEVRENGPTRTLVWRVAQVGAGETLDAFAFTVDRPLIHGLQFFMRWIDESGIENIEQFTDDPPIQSANQVDVELTLSHDGFMAAGDSGVQIAGPVQDPPLKLAVRVLPASFNPPPEYGALWWCSITEITGIPAGGSVLVAAPLRRPVAPFTLLSLFHQNEDGSWSPAEGVGIVTADGLYVEYSHPGGVIALGGDQSIQPASVSLITPTDGSSNTISASEDSQGSQVIAGSGPADQTDGSSNTILIGEATPAGDGAVRGDAPTADPATLTDGTSNTILVGEATPAGDGEVRGAAPTANPATLTDGTSNTIVIGEATPAGDGEVRGTAPTADPATLTDGTSNTIVIGEATPAGDGSVRGTAPTADPATLTDGTSNTILIGEATPAGDGEVRGTAPTANPATLTDGTSNTIVIGEAPGANLVQIVTATPTLEQPTIAPTRTPKVVKTLPPTILINPTISSPEARPATGQGARVVIITTSDGVLQCMVGGLMCVKIRRSR